MSRETVVSAAITHEGELYSIRVWRDHISIGASFWQWQGGRLKRIFGCQLPPAVQDAARRHLGMTWFQRTNP